MLLGPCIVHVFVPPLNSRVLVFRVCTSANVVAVCIVSVSLEVTTGSTVKSTDRTEKTDKDAYI